MYANALLKKPLLSQKNIKYRITFLAEYGILCVNDEPQWNMSCMMMLQSGVFGNLLRNLIINASLPPYHKHGGRAVIVWGVFLAAGIRELLHWEKSFIFLEHRRMWLVSHNWKVI